MSRTVIRVENISKQYRLGQVGTGTISHDINRWWHMARGKEDPYLKIGEENDRTRKSAGDYVWALKDINFEIKQGEVVGIIGRNGAGKSTLLKILSRTTAPTTGTVKVKGRIASLLEVGTGFHPELSGRENVYLNGAILGMTKAEISRKFDEIVDFAGVERYISTPVKRYSSGMYVRLAFGVAAHLEPEILIVDEVLAVGDVEFQKKAIGKMRDVSGKEGRTVLFVSHNTAAILNLCQSCVFLQKGVIIENGPARTVVSKYMSGETKLIGESFITPDQSSKTNPFFSLTKFYFKNYPLTGEAIPASENLRLELLVEGSFGELDRRFNLGYILKNEVGETLIISYTTDQPERDWINLKKGKTSIKTTIDTSLLNEGRYHVYLVASLHCERMLITEEDNIRLDFEVIGNRGNSPYWINKRNSLIAPYVSWVN
jgi:lipopolysaccharide transport system ATP-binding protein